MKSAPVNYQLDSQMHEELTLSEARKIAKDMVCLKYCAGGNKEEIITEHVIACPYWNPFKKGSKGGE